MKTNNELIQKLKKYKAYRLREERPLIGINAKAITKSMVYAATQKHGYRYIIPAQTELYLRN